MKFVYDSLVHAEHLVLLFSLVFWVQFSSFGVFLVWRRPTLEFVV